MRNDLIINQSPLVPRLVTRGVTDSGSMKGSKNSRYNTIIQFFFQCQLPFTQFQKATSFQPHIIMIWDKREKWKQKRVQKNKRKDRKKMKQKDRGTMRKKADKGGEEQQCETRKTQKRSVRRRRQKGATTTKPKQKERRNRLIKAATSEKDDEEEQDRDRWQTGVWIAQQLQRFQGISLEASCIQMLQISKQNHRRFDGQHKRWGSRCGNRKRGRNCGPAECHCSCCTNSARKSDSCYCWGWGRGWGWGWRKHVTFFCTSRPGIDSRNGWIITKQRSQNFQRQR